MKPWKRDLAYIREVGPDEPRFDEAVQRVWGELERLRTYAKKSAMRRARADGNLDKALAALREIASEVHGSEKIQNVYEFARAAITEIEGEA